MLEMLNVTLSGKCNITGSIIGETSVSSTGDFSIVSKKGARYQIGSSFININGHLTLDRTLVYELVMLSETFGTSFPRLLDDVELKPEIEILIVDSLGSMIFCPHQSICTYLYDLITQPMTNLFQNHLQKRFAVSYF